MPDFSICPDPDHREALYDSGIRDDRAEVPLVSVLHHMALILALIFVYRSWHLLI